MGMMTRIALATMLALAPAAAGAQRDWTEKRLAWNRPAEPFRIVDNVWYVGTAGLSAFLVTGPRGHVLIDAALPESADRIAANIRRLGFRLRDVKYLLVNHSHFDHAGGLAALKATTGACLIASAGDRADLESGRTLGRDDLVPFPQVRVDRVIADGEQVTLGPVVLTAMLTPGHTRGATTYALRTAHHDVLFVSSLSVAGQKLANNPDYPQAAADFRRSFARLGATKADVFLNYHAEGFDLDARRARQRAGQADAFVDREALTRSIAVSKAKFEAELAAQTR